ncbi:MAG: acyl-CoA dehydrogenase family protein [Candidatus Aminicenantales bacterium]
MDFDLNEEQRMAVEGARAFAREKLAPAVEELDAAQEPNLSALKELGALGYLGMTVPEEYGGTGMGAVAYAGAMIEFSKEDAGTSVGVSVQNSLVNDAIMMFGTEEQKKTFLPKLTTGEWLGCFSLTEAGAGSDPGSLRASAVRDGGHYVLSGTKNFTTNGGFADVIIAFFQTDKDKGSKGISAFIIPKETPGFSVGKHENEKAAKKRGWIGAD